MVVHVDFRYYKYMYKEEKSARYLVNYKNFFLDHFNYNEFLNFWTYVRIKLDKHMF